jgi:hypothetical protein
MYDDPDYYDPGYYYDHYPPSEEIQEESEPEELPSGPTDEAPPSDPQPDGPSLSELVNGEVEAQQSEAVASDPECNCIECLQARGEEITPEMIEESRFGCGINQERGYEVLAGFGQQDGTEAEQVTQLCECWYPNVAKIPDNIKMEIHRWVSMTVPVQGQEIPEDEREDLATDELMSDMASILGRFRKNSR